MDVTHVSSPSPPHLLPNYYPGENTCIKYSRFLRRSNDQSNNAFHSLPQPVIIFSQLANITSMANMPSTNDTKNKLFEILLVPNIVHPNDNEIA